MQAVASYNRSFRLVHSSFRGHVSVYLIDMKQKHFASPSAARLITVRAWNASLTLYNPITLRLCGSQLNLNKLSKWKVCNFLSFFPFHALVPFTLLPIIPRLKSVRLRGRDSNTAQRGRLQLEPSFLSS